MKRSWLYLTAISVLLSLVVPIVYGGLDSMRAIGAVPPWAFLLLIAMVLSGWLFNAARIRLLTQALGSRLSLRAALGTVVAAEFAGVATPAGAGNPASYILLLSRRHGLPLSGGAAVVAVDQFTDLVFFGTAIPVAIVLFAVDGGISHPLRLAALVVGLFVLGTTALLLLLYNFRSVALAVGRLSKRMPRLHRLRFRLARGVLRFRNSIRLLLGMGPAKLLLLYLFCLGHWMLRYGVLPVVVWILGESVPWGYLFVIQGVLLFVGHISVLPGGGGGVEIGFSALLAPYLSATVTATALLLWRFVTFYWYLLLGAPIFLVLTGKAISQGSDLPRRT